MSLKSSFWLPKISGMGDDPTSADYSGDDSLYLDPTEDPEAYVPVVVNSGAVSPAAPVSPANKPVTATASSSSSSPWSTVGSAFSDIFGNFTKNVLPGVVNKQLGVSLPGQAPGTVGTAPGAAAGTAAAGTAAAGAAAGGGLLIAALAVGAFLLLGRGSRG